MVSVAIRPILLIISKIEQKPTATIFQSEAYHSATAGCGRITLELPLYKGVSVDAQPQP